ncbi:hypothetical protein [Sphingobacterium pedocola]|nr:hypothetical protein [Sphingobacterium pedocola]
MLRGYVGLYYLDKDSQFIDAFKANPDHAWNSMRYKVGFFGKD